MKSKFVTIRMKPDEIALLHKVGSNYNISGTQLLKKIALALIGAETNIKESEKLLTDMAKAFAQQTEQLEFYTNVIADSSNRIAQSVSHQLPLELRKRRKIKKRI